MFGLPGKRIKGKGGGHMGKMMILFTCWMIGWLIITIIITLALRRAEECEDATVLGRTKDSEFSS